jgi:hypothetical protein
MPDRHYPAPPPMLDGESHEDWNDRMLDRDTYDHYRNRQCSIGWHSECSQRKNGSTLGATGQCECPHHTDPRLVEVLKHLVPFAQAMAGGSAKLSNARMESIATHAIDVAVDILAVADKAHSPVG